MRLEPAVLERLGAGLGVPVPGAALGPLTAFAELVALWNSRLNLTGAREPEALAEILFADALILSSEELMPRGARFVDVGAGAGAPALPLTVLRDDLRATLVEPLRKRVAFIRTAIGTFDLAARAEVVEQRLEGGAVPGSPFDVALSRATFDPEEWLERAAPLAPLTVVLVAADPLPRRADATLRVERHYELPFSRAPRALGVYERTTERTG